MLRQDAIISLFQTLKGPLSAEAPEPPIVIGESFAAKAGLSKNDVANIGKYRFPSLQEAMNFMSGYGWKLAEAYSTTLAGSANTVWVIYKDVTDDSQLAEGLFEEKE